MYTLEEIIRLREDRNLIFGSGKILFLTREIKFISLSDGLSFFLLHISHDCPWKSEKDTIDILIWKDAEVSDEVSYEFYEWCIFQINIRAHVINVVHIFQSSTLPLPRQFVTNELGYRKVEYKFRFCFSLWARHLLLALFTPAALVPKR